ncbi:MAG: hypothetical protein OXH70_21810 [Acidobacteria bacterium]|nr:hypothetical protein [Acidobacteriota bacterium]
MVRTSAAYKVRDELAEQTVLTGCWSGDAYDPLSAATAACHEIEQRLHLTLHLPRDTFLARIVVGDELFTAEFDGAGVLVDGPVPEPA